METADVVIVGGGIVGSAAAYFLSIDASFQGRRIVVVERDPSFAQASTSRSAGGLRQQFSTPENIALSQFTLALFRRLETLFGAGADVGFREQGYLIMASLEARTVLAENVLLQQMRADILLLDPPPHCIFRGWRRTGAAGASAGRRNRSHQPGLLFHNGPGRGAAVIHAVTTSAGSRVKRSSR
jgi:glycine/D-amino acid oxidase-like deaminating enzyme